MPTVTFLPSGKAMESAPEETILDVAIRAEDFITATCGGKGVCGKCRVTLESGSIEPVKTSTQAKVKLKENEVLACKAKVVEDITVRLPEMPTRFKAALVEGTEVVADALPGFDKPSPLAAAVELKLTEPTLDDPTGDFERTARAVGSTEPGSFIASPASLNELAAALRDGNWSATAVTLDRGCQTELVTTKAGTAAFKPLGLAVDLGTTTVVAYLVDLRDGTVLGAASGLNRQIAVGDDVVSRMFFSKKPGGLDRLRRNAVDTINDLVAELASENGIDPHDIVAAALAGNTVMTHLIAGLNPWNLLNKPYVPVVNDMPVTPAEHIGLNSHPRAGVFFAPCNAAYVGGDISAGVLFTGFHREETMTLFVDVGTNGELVLGSQDFLMTGACSAGPAFEGGGIEHGTRAIPGAIDSVKIDPDTHEAEWTTIGKEKPRGICGSGLVDLLSALFLSGAIDGRGKFVDGLPDHLVRDGEFGKEYVVVPGKDTILGEDITFSEGDIEHLMRSKGAVYGGIQSLLKQAGLPQEAIGRVLVAGGFGHHLNIQHTIDIGMFPDLDPSLYHYVGNSSLAGAYLALMSKANRDEIRTITRGMTYIDFSSSNLFFDEYQSALFLPHTDMNAFPSVAERAKAKGREL